MIFAGKRKRGNKVEERKKCEKDENEIKSMDWKYCNGIISCGGCICSNATNREVASYAI